MSECLPQIDWIKNDPEKYKFFWDQSEFLCALQVTNHVTGKTKWEFHRVVTDCDGEGMHLRYPGIDRECFDDWVWEDFISLEEALADLDQSGNSQS